MTKRKYLRRLRKALGRTPEREKEELIEYYAEIIDESYERGKTTKEIFATLETPEQAASDYFSANEGRMNERRRRPSRDEYFSRGRNDDDYDDRRSDDRRYDDRRYDDRPPRRSRETCPPRKEPKKRNIWLTALLFPIWFPLLAVLVVLGLAISIVVVTLLIVDVVLVVSFALAGLYCLVMSFGLFPSNGMIALTQIGAAFIFFGLAVLFELTIKPLGKGVGAYFRVVFRRAPAGGAIAQTHWVRTMAMGVAFLILGGAIGAFGFGELDWNWRNLADVGNIVTTERTIEPQDDKLSLKADNFALKIVAGEGQEAKLVWKESDELAMNYTCENGVVVLQSGAWQRKISENLKQAWKRGVMFSTVISCEMSATLYLPADYRGDVEIDVDNGALTLAGTQDNVSSYGNVSLKTSNGMINVEWLEAEDVTVRANNGYISLNHILARNTVRAESNNGMMQFRHVEAPSVTGETSNGYIKCERVSGDEINFSTNNGAVKGTIVGALEQFRIFAKVQNGNCNLTNCDVGEKSLSVKTSNGSINISFEA